MTPFSLLVKPVGARCNLACDYCFYLDKAALYPSGPAQMPDAVLVCRKDKAQNVKKIVDALNESDRKELL